MSNRESIDGTRPSRLAMRDPNYVRIALLSGAAGLAFGSMLCACGAASHTSEGPAVAPSGIVVSSSAPAASSPPSTPPTAPTASAPVVTPATASAPVVTPATGSGVPVGGACTNGTDCADGTCEGKGCGPYQGRCVARDRVCTRDLKMFCGCDGATFRSSGSCAGKLYAHAGPCP